MKKKDVLELIVNITQNAIKCEENKEHLNDHPKFEPYALFTRIDREDKGYLDKRDFINFLVDNQISIPLNRNTVDLFIEYYDRDFDDHLSFSEFLNFILNKEHNLIRSIATQRETYKLCNDEYLEDDLEAYTAKLVLSEFFLFEYANMKKMEIFAQNKIEALADLFNLFIEIDSNKDGYLSIEDFSQFLSSKRVNICSNELMSFISLFDEDLDGELNWNEFLFMILPSPSGFKYDVKELKKMELQYNNYYSSLQRKEGNRSNINTNQYSTQMKKMDMNDISNYDKDNGNDESYIRETRYKEEKSQYKASSSSNNKNKETDKLNQSKPNINKAFSSLSNLLLEVIDFEMQIDDMRIQLYNDPNFDINSLFVFFDRYKNQYISLMDFQDALELFDITNKNMLLIFGKYDDSNKGRLTINDFYEIFQPQGEKYTSKKRKLNKNNKEINSERDKDKDIDIITKNHISQLFNQMINYESFLALLPKWYEKNKSDVFFAFDQLDVNSNGYINEEEFNTLFMGKIQENNLLFLMEKIDSDQDGKITLDDLISLFK